jgi:hypothetical protein
VSGLTDEKDSLPRIHVTGAGKAWRLSIFLSWQFLFAFINAQSTPLLLCLYLLRSALPLVLIKAKYRNPDGLDEISE